VDVEFRVSFDGLAFGLPENRLSLTAFAEPLALLLSALQRTASQIVSSALDNSEYGNRGGKFAAQAKLLDLELVSLGKGSAEPVFACTTSIPAGGQALLVPDLAIQSTERLARDLAEEAKGTMRNAAARKYLRSIPREVTKQRYTVSVDGKVIFVTSFGSAVLASAPPVLGHLVRRSARVVGVGFEPATVRLKIDGRAHTFAATEGHVEIALANRHRDVTVAIVDDGDHSRIIWVRPAEDDVPAVSLESTVAHLKMAWGETLRILAQ